MALVLVFRARAAIFVLVYSVCVAVVAVVVAAVVRAIRLKVVRVQIMGYGRYRASKRRKKGGESEFFVASQQLLSVAHAPVPKPKHGVADAAHEFVVNAEIVGRVDQPGVQPTALLWRQATLVRGQNKNTHLPRSPGMERGGGRGWREGDLEIWEEGK